METVGAPVIDADAGGMVGDADGLATIDGDGVEAGLVFTASFLEEGDFVGVGAPLNSADVYWSGDEGAGSEGGGEDVEFLPGGAIFFGEWAAGDGERVGDVFSGVAGGDFGNLSDAGDVEEVQWTGFPGGPG